nr:ubinuclein-1-like isoform X2 [Ipomoea batatas]
MKPPIDEGSSGGEPGVGRVSTSYEAAGGRQRFTVELRPGETTIVSWKKLLKEATGFQSNGNEAPGPAPITSAAAAELQPHILPPHNASPGPGFSPEPPVEKEAKDAPPGNRLNAVIEKIERLYVGKQSDDDEDLDDVPDEDEYDTEDSFIDDTELDDYFQVDNSAIKHDGFFVNRGKLERIEPASQQNQQPNKRRKKDQTKGQSGSDDGCNPIKPLKVGKKAGKSVLHAAGTSSPPYGVVMPTLSRENANVQNQEVNFDMQKTEVLHSKNVADKLKESSETSNQRSNDRISLPQEKSSGRSANISNGLDQSFQQREKSGIYDERLDVSASEGKRSTQTVRRDGSSVRSKITMLEKAIRDLEKFVAESRPPNAEVQDGDNSSQAIKRRLPPEIKQKLAKVARYAQASHGKLSKELINRLMSIVGHLVQLRTLKRNLKIMINMGLSAKQEKDNRVQQIKREVAEMIKDRIPLMKSKAIEQQPGTSDDFQSIATEEKEAFKRKYCMDSALEDRICDLYDLYVEGLEEDAGPQVRKLYAELAAYWPNGFMDNHGIKRAICRAKDRRKTLYNRHKNQEKMRRNKILAQKEEDAYRVETTTHDQPVQIQEKSGVDARDHGSTSTNKPISSTAAINVVGRIPVPSLGGTSLDRPKTEKVKGTSNSTDRHISTDALTKKKMKRKPEPVRELGEGQYLPEKLSSKQVEYKPQEPIAAPVRKPSIQLNEPPSFEELT